MITTTPAPLARIDKATSRCQLLADHLVGVGKEAAKCFPFPDIADLAGRFHDLGKYAPGWQSDLRAGVHGRDHSTAGAVLLASAGLGAWGFAAAMTVGCHHSGLAELTKFKEVKWW